MKSGSTVKKYEIEMCNGPLFTRIIQFAIPVMLSNILQLAYTAADQLIVGRFVGTDALGAVGCTASLSHLIICLVLGLSVGANTVVARSYGAGDTSAVSRTVHTAVIISIISGVLLGLCGFALARPLLVLMKTDAAILDMAVLYMQIYFLGVPLVSLYNFTSAIMRAVGDTKRPMLFLTMSGILNIGLNLFFVLALKLGVMGVALATVISEGFAGLMTLAWIMMRDTCYKFEIKKLRLYKAESVSILKIGVPASVQSSMFSFSNTIMQTGINSLGKAAISGNTAAGIIDNFIYQACNSLYHTNLAFCGQNYGAQKLDRVRKSFYYCSIISLILGFIIGMGALLFSDDLLKLFILDDAAAIAMGKERLRITCLTYFLCGIMDVGCGGLRAINRSFSSMMNVIFGVCVFRIVWIYTVFAAFPSMMVLFISYPVSWMIASTLSIAEFEFFLNKLKKTCKLQNAKTT